MSASLESITGLNEWLNDRNDKLYQCYLEYCSEKNVPQKHISTKEEFEKLINFMDEKLGANAVIDGQIVTTVNMNDIVGTSNYFSNLKDKPAL